MKTGLKVSCLVATVLAYFFVFFKCLEYISLKSDAMVLIGVVGLLILLAIGIAGVLKAGKIAAKYMEKFKQ